MNVVFDILKFIAFFVFSLVVPGYVLVAKTKIDSIYPKLFLSIVLGFSLTTISYYIHPFVYYALLGISLLIFVLKHNYLDFTLGKTKLWNKRLLLLFLIILAGTIFQNVITFRSGLTYDYGIGFWGALAHDGVWHQALIGQLVKAVPPLNPGLAGATLTNYHYFYDLLVAICAKYTGISIADLIYRFFPLTFSILLGTGSFLLARKIFKNSIAGLFAAYLTYFGSSFGWIVELFRKGFIFDGESNFWANQPVSININPPFTISLLMVIAVIYLLAEYEIKKNYWKLMILATVSGAIISFKVYGGLIVLASLVVLAVKKAIFDKDRIFGLFVLSGLLISAAIFIPNSRGSTSFITFLPFWIIHSMVDIVDRVGWSRLSLARRVGLDEKDWFKFIVSEAVGLTIFILGNLGTRIVAFVTLLIIPFKTWLKNNVYFLLGIMVFASIIPTLLFVQKTDPWNIIQFSYYFIFLIMLFAAYALAVFIKVFEKTPDSKSGDESNTYVSSSFKGRNR